MGFPCVLWTCVWVQFRLMCEENQWKLALAGSLNNLGQFMGIPLKGILADKYVYFTPYSNRTTEFYIYEVIYPTLHVKYNYWTYHTVLKYHEYYRFGRKFSMIFGAVTSAVLSLIQSFSINYPMFLTLELLSAMLSSGIYTATFVLGVNINNSMRINKKNPNVQFLDLYLYFMNQV